MYFTHKPESINLLTSLLDVKWKNQLNWFGTDIYVVDQIKSHLNPVSPVLNYFWPLREADIRKIKHRIACFLPNSKCKSMIHLPLSSAFYSTVCWELFSCQMLSKPSHAVWCRAHRVYQSFPAEDSNPLCPTIDYEIISESEPKQWGCESNTMSCDVLKKAL